MSLEAGDERLRLITYKRLQSLLGCLGFALPVCAFIYGLVDARGSFAAWRLESISGTYYTNMHDLFVAALCITGVFLICYSGYKGDPSWMSPLAGAMAIVVGFVPTAPPDGYDTGPLELLFWEHPSRWTALAHFGAAATLFVLLAAMCAFLFTRTAAEPTPQTAGDWMTFLHRLRWRPAAAGDRAPEARARAAATPPGVTPQKIRRNRLYIACAAAMLAAEVFQALCAGFERLGLWHPSRWPLPELLIVETICLFAFCTAWLVKGGWPVSLMRWLGLGDP